MMDDEEAGDPPEVVQQKAVDREKHKEKAKERAPPEVKKMVDEEKPEEEWAEDDLGGMDDKSSLAEFEDEAAIAMSDPAGPPEDSWEDEVGLKMEDEPEWEEDEGLLMEDPADDDLEEWMEDEAGR